MSMKQRWKDVIGAIALKLLSPHNEAPCTKFTGLGFPDGWPRIPQEHMSKALKFQNKN